MQRQMAEESVVSEKRLNNIKPLWSANSRAAFVTASLTGIISSIVLVSYTGWSALFLCIVFAFLGFFIFLGTGTAMDARRIPVQILTFFASMFMYGVGMLRLVHTFPPFVNRLALVLALAYLALGMVTYYDLDVPDDYWTKQTELSAAIKILGYYLVILCLKAAGPLALLYIVFTELL